MHVSLDRFDEGQLEDLLKPGATGTLIMYPNGNPPASWQPWYRRMWVRFRRLIGKPIEPPMITTPSVVWTPNEDPSIPVNTLTSWTIDHRPVPFDDVKAESVTL